MSHSPNGMSAHQPRRPATVGVDAAGRHSGRLLDRRRILLSRGTPRVSRLYSRDQAFEEQKLTVKTLEPVAAAALIAAPEIMSPASPQKFSKLLEEAACPFGNGITRKGAQDIYNLWHLSYLYDSSPSVRELSVWCTGIAGQLWGIMEQNRDCLQTNKLKTATYLMLLRRIVQFCVRNAVYADDLSRHVTELVYCQYDSTRPLSETHSKPFKYLFEEREQHERHQASGNIISRSNNRTLINERCKRTNAEHLLKSMLFEVWKKHISGLKTKRIITIAKLASTRSRFAKLRVLSAWKLYHQTCKARAEEAEEGQQKLNVTHSEARKLSIVIEQQQLEIALLKNQCSDYQRDLILSQSELDVQHQQLADFEQESSEFIKKGKQVHSSELEKLKSQISNLQNEIEEQRQQIETNKSHTLKIYKSAIGSTDDQDKTSEQERPYAKEFLNELQDPSDESLPLEFIRWCMRQLTSTRQSTVSNLTTAVQDGDVFSHVALYCFPEVCHSTILKMIDSRRKLQKIFSVLQLYGFEPSFSIDEIIGGNSVATSCLSLLILECWVTRRNMLCITPSSSAEGSSLTALFDAYQDEKNTWKAILNPAKAILNKRLFEKVNIPSGGGLDDILVKDKLLFTKLRTKVQLSYSQRGGTPPGIPGNDYVSAVLRSSIDSIRSRNVSISGGRSRGGSPNTPTKIRSPPVSCSSPTKIRSPPVSGCSSPTKIRSPPVSGCQSPTKIKSPPIQSDSPTKLVSPTVSSPIKLPTAARVNFEEPGGSMLPETVISIEEPNLDPSKIKSSPPIAATRVSIEEPNFDSASPLKTALSTRVSIEEPNFDSGSPQRVPLARVSIEEPTAGENDSFKKIRSPPSVATRVSIEEPNFNSGSPQRVPLAARVSIEEPTAVENSSLKKIKSPPSVARVSIEEPNFKTLRGKKISPLDPAKLLHQIGGLEYTSGDNEQSGDDQTNDENKLPMILSPKVVLQDRSEPSNDIQITNKTSDSSLPTVNTENSPQRGLLKSSTDNTSFGGLTIDVQEVKDEPQTTKLAGNTPDFASLAPVRNRKRAMSYLHKSKEGTVISPTMSSVKTTYEGRKRSGTTIGNAGIPAEMRPGTSHGLLSATLTSDGGSLSSTRKRRGSFIQTQSPSKEIFVEDFSPADVMRVEELLVLHFGQLRNIYKYYSRITNKSDDMSTSEFVKLLSDCHILDSSTVSINLAAGTTAAGGQTLVGARQVTALQVELLLSRMRNCGSSSSNQASKRKEEGYGPQPFTEFLLRISQYRYSKICSSVGDRFEKLLSNDVFPNALWSEIDEFRNLFYQPKMQKVLNDFKSRLHKVFHHYNHDKRTGNTMSSKDFWQMLSESKMSGESLTQYDALIIYNNSHRSDEMSVGDCMTFAEFLEAITAVALCKNSVLILPPSHRLREFLVKFHTALGVANPRLRTGSVGVR